MNWCTIHPLPGMRTPVKSGRWVSLLKGMECTDFSHSTDKRGPGGKSTGLTNVHPTHQNQTVNMQHTLKGHHTSIMGRKTKK